jgi:fructose-1,6-bisphosphatase/inositol monophosphatase family enzyme
MAERIGDYLVRTKALQQSQADEVVRVQKGGDTRSFGAIAVSLGFVAQGTIDAFLATQGK